MSTHGTPCWYELTTGDLAASQAFYGGLLNWTFADAGMPGFTYILASAGGDMVAGLMTPDQPMPEFWMVYFAVDDADAAAAKAKSLGGGVHVEPADIPGTGRFAVLTDPAGCPFGILQPLPGGTGGAYDQMKQGHGNWHDYASADANASQAFYGALLGWTVSRSYEEGGAREYRVLNTGGTDFGGIGPIPPGGRGGWTPYFGASSITAAVQTVADQGGKVLLDPMEVPNGAYIIYAADPRGAVFAMVGGK
jgi:hypothetical protein